VYNNLAIILKIAGRSFENNHNASMYNNLLKVIKKSFGITHLSSASNNNLTIIFKIVRRIFENTHNAATS
jgi:hypothetical protein